MKIKLRNPFGSEIPAHKKIMMNYLISYFFLGTIVAGECGNTCVCSSAGEPVCTNNPCTGSSTTSTTTTTTASTTTTTTTTTTSTSGSTSCVTTSGPAVGQTCVFPFTWNGVTHNTCADWIYGGQPAGLYSFLCILLHPFPNFCINF